MTARQHGSERFNVQFFAQVPGDPQSCSAEERYHNNSVSGRRQRLETEIYITKKQQFDFILKLPQLEDWRIASSLLLYVHGSEMAY